MNKYVYLLLKNKISVLLIFLLFICLPRHAFATTGTIENKLDDYVTNYEGTTAGLATIVIDNDEVFYKMSGYADIEQGIKVDEETVFEWGSVSKLLIWVSVMQLAEAGLLDLQADIREYLPKDFNSAIAFDQPITMIHLMNHSTGFDDSYTDLMIQSPAKEITLREALEAADIKQVFPPGDVVAYSNYGSALAAYIIEEVSGLDYREYVRKHIFTPLHMTQTAIDSEQKDNQWVKEQRKKIQGYTSDHQLIYPNLYTIPIYPSGSAIGTATDLQKLLAALLTEDGYPLFKHRETIELMFEPTVYFPETEIPRIAHGLFFLPSESQHVFGHGGNTIAFSTSLYVDREYEIGVLVMTNQQNESNFTLGIPQLIFGDFKYIGNEPGLEESFQWEGIYQPARLSYHGFSKIYGLLQRGNVKHTEKYHLTMNDLYYTQQSPGVYVTKDDFSIYSLDIYSVHPTVGKTLSSTYTDLLYVSVYQHVFEWCLILFGLAAILFSLGYIMLIIVRRIRNKKQQHILITIQHILNVLMISNVVWMSYKTLSMTTYQSLKPFFAMNIFYIAITFGISGYMIIRKKRSYSRKYEHIVGIMTIIFSFILCANLLYWEFYH